MLITIHTYSIYPFEIHLSLLRCPFMCWHQLSSQFWSESLDHRSIACQVWQNETTKKKRWETRMCSLPSKIYLNCTCFRCNGNEPSWDVGMHLRLVLVQRRWRRKSYCFRTNCFQWSDQLQYDSIIFTLTSTIKKNNLIQLLNICIKMTKCFDDLCSRLLLGGSNMSS